jgi:hypothetical protein
MSDVTTDQLALEGYVKRGADDHVQFEDGLGCQPSPGSAAGDGERLVELIEVVGPEPS